ncbi:MAG: hypothetical protein QOK01_830, partial [Alphaproteobacteria bacterium]|nr:hypothetical protein [Alphaproteobacteria bacterium]
MILDHPRAAAHRSPSTLSRRG